ETQSKGHGQHSSVASESEDLRGPGCRELCVQFGKRSTNRPRTVLNESLLRPRPPPVKVSVTSRPSALIHAGAKVRKKTLCSHSRSLPVRTSPKRSSEVQ